MNDSVVTYRQVALDIRLLQRLGTNYYDGPLRISTQGFICDSDVGMSQ